MKNTKPNLLNLFVHKIISIFRANQVRKESKVIGYD